MSQDVLIAGAGPVGLTLAVELARYGAPVRIVDRTAARPDKSKALVLWSRTLELMDRPGVTTALLEAGHPQGAAIIIADGKRIGRINLDGAPTPYPFGLMISQSETERILEEHLSALGVVVERNLRLARFEEGGSGVTATLQSADGREEIIESQWLVGCDGADSTVRHGLGHDFQGEPLISDWALGDVSFNGAPAAGEIEIHWHAAGGLGFFPMENGRCRVISDTGTSYRSGRVFLAGDAAHIHNPAGGQGINTGMQDACNLAWKLALAHSGAANADTLLSTYSPERSWIGDQILDVTGKVASIASRPRMVKQAIRNEVAEFILGFSTVREVAAKTLLEISVGYPHSPLNGPMGDLDAGPKTGERAPVRAGEAPFGGGRLPRFALCAADDALSAAVIKRFPALLEPQVRTAYDEEGIWLVRPDGYIAMSAQPNELTSVIDYLAKLAGNAERENETNLLLSSTSRSVQAP